MNPFHPAHDPLDGLDGLEAAADDRRNGSHDLGSRLHGLAGEVAAPASSGVRQAITHRRIVLRRRRQTRRIAAGSAVVLLAVVGTLAATRDRADVELGPAVTPPADGLPALTLDLPGWSAVDAEESDVAGTAADPATDQANESAQVFQDEGDPLGGAVVYVEHHSASDAVVATGDEQEVDVNGAPGYLAQVGDRVSLRWSPGRSDSQAALVASGVGEDEVLAFARALRPVDDDLGFPPTADDRFGFVVDGAPAGLVEVQRSVERRLHVRQATFGRTDGAIVEIQVDDRGQWSFETGIYAPAEAAAWEGDETVDVLGHRALLRRSPEGTSWVASWRHAENAWVTVTITPSLEQGLMDRATVDDILAGIDELPEPAWQDLLATTPPD
jgi:hypothetical protein